MLLFQPNSFFSNISTTKRFMLCTQKTHVDENVKSPLSTWTTPLEIKANKHSKLKPVHSVLSFPKPSQTIPTLWQDIKATHKTINLNNHVLILVVLSDVKGIPRIQHVSICTEGVQSLQTLSELLLTEQYFQDQWLRCVCKSMAKATMSFH